MTAQKLFEGTNALAELQRELHVRDIHHVFLVRGKHSYEACGAQSHFEGIFAAEQIGVTEFYDFDTNPKMEDVEKGLSQLSATEAAAILAVGGGSVLDMAKLIRYKYTSQRLPLIAVPTTAGTGAEATPFAVCYVNGVKTSVDNPDILPDIAVLFPEFTYANSPYLTACTGFDALAQAIEAYWNVNATSVSDRYAEEAISLIWDTLPACVNHPLPELRNKMLKGAYWAGKAIAITRTTAPHAFSYAFTSKCGYPHGHAVSLTFPFFFELNVNGWKSGNTLQSQVDKSLYQEKMNRLIDTLQLDIYRLKEEFLIYIQSLRLELKVKQNNIKQLLDCVNLERLKNNPSVVGAEEIKELDNWLNS
jgi:alcohol dehydrogenase class IV